MRPSSISVFFLVGCSRSGTTWLQSLLAAHPEVGSFPESQFFHYLLPSQYERRRYALGLISGRLRPRLKTFFDEIGRPELLDCLPQLIFIQHYTRSFIKILKSLAAEQEKTVLLEKTPDHIYYLESIEKFVPEAKFIHLIRNGSDVVASLYEATHRYPQPWGGVRDIDVCINDWMRAIQASHKYVENPNHMMVRYEKLVANPPEILKKLCKFMGIEFNETMLTEYNNAAQKLVLEAAGRTVKPAIQNCNSKKFYEVFDEQQQQYVLERLSQVNLDGLNSV